MTGRAGVVVVLGALGCLITGGVWAQGVGAQGIGAQGSGKQSLPIPPIPPDVPVSRYEAAPTPNLVNAPTVSQPAPGAEVRPTLMGPKQFYQGEGFLNGSTVQSEQQRRARPAAGFNLTVPLR